MKGSITIEYTVWCGNPDCYVWDTLLGVSSKTDAIERARKAGYVKSKHYGWLCPNCRHLSKSRKRAVDIVAEAEPERGYISIDIMDLRRYLDERKNDHA